MQSTWHLGLTESGENTDKGGHLIEVLCKQAATENSRGQILQNDYDCLLPIRS